MSGSPRRPAGRWWAGFPFPEVALAAACHLTSPRTPSHPARAAAVLVCDGPTPPGAAGAGSHFSRWGSQAASRDFRVYSSLRPTRARVARGAVFPGLFCRGLWAPFRRGVAPARGRSHAPLLSASLPPVRGLACRLRVSVRLCRPEGSVVLSVCFPSSFFPAGVCLCTSRDPLC